MRQFVARTKPRTAIRYLLEATEIEAPRDKHRCPLTRPLVAETDKSATNASLGRHRY